MATEYDRRRPRLPVHLAKAVDGARGQVPFNRYVVETLEKALNQFAASSVLPSGAQMTSRGVEPQPDLDPPDVAPAGAPRSEAFVCPVASCEWPGARKQADGPCPRHGRNLIPRRA